ncbi:MAG: hypothetical protein HUU30_15315 [Burkholderiaceae bacterium]|nr:hypothetical protein [Burkholderiaceae bacterium]
MATLTVTDIVVSEADGFAEFIVRLDGTAPGVVTVQYQNTNYSAIHNKDYRYVDGTLTFAPGETTKTVRLELIDTCATSSSTRKPAPPPSRCASATTTASPQALR